MIARSEWTNTDPNNPDGYTAHSQSGHAVRFDVSAEHLEGPTPMEAVLMALCACTSVDVVSILQKKRQNLEGLKVTATAEQAKTFPRVFTHIKLTYAVKGNLSRKAVEDAVALSQDTYCPVSNMLGKTAQIEREIVFENGGLEP